MRKRTLTSAVVILAIGSIAVPAGAKADGGGVREVRLEDRCDPASFNAAIGPGTCIPTGSRGDKVTFDQFLAQLNPADFGHEKWLNNPDETHIDEGDVIKAKVRGGEFHTFTEVDEFGPGCIDFINQSLGLTGPAPTEFECFGPGGFAETSGILPNGLSTLTVSGLDVGTHKFMCIIHPWMRTVVEVEND